MNRGVARAEAIRAQRKETLREEISSRGYHDHAHKNIQKIENLEPEDPHFQHRLQKHKIAAELQMRMMNKYIPDLKAVEIDANLTATDMTDAELDEEIGKFEGDVASR